MMIFDDDTNDFQPSNDGIDHINIYSRGRTELGRMLSNFYHSPFSTEQFGHFESMEGFYFWYFTGMKYNEFRQLVGNSAKKHAKIYSKERTDELYLTESQLTDLYKACTAKVVQNEIIYEKLRLSTLPFTHYYVYSNNKVEMDGFDWLSDIYTNLRSIIR